MTDLELKIEQLYKLKKLEKEEYENLLNISRLEKERASLGMRGSQHHQREIAAIKKKLNITEDLYDFEYEQKKKLFALDRAEIASGKAGKEKKKYIKRYEQMEYKSYFRIDKKKRSALRADILAKQMGIKKIHELEKLALRKEKKERDKYTRSYKVEDKEEAASKGFGRAAGQVAGDIDNALGSFLKPFGNKSINPLKWLKQGSDVGKELEDSSVNFKEWGIALKKATANRKMRAGKEIKAREKAEEDANKAADKAAEKLVKGKPKARGKGKAEETKDKPKPKTKARGKGKAEEVKEKPKARGRGKGKAEDVLGAGRTPPIEGPKKQSFLSKLLGGGVPAEDTKKVTKKATGGSSKAAGGAGIKHLGTFMAATKGLNMLVFVVEKLALALGLLSKLNIVFAIISALAGLISKVADLDDYLKKLNKTFATMAGPLIGMGSVGKEMETFNDALFDIRRNIKLGLKSEDISKMFGSVASEGMAPQALATKAGSYDSAITGIRKSSIMLGVSFEDMGKMVTEQMRDLRSSFDDTRDALQEVGYNAAKAGINTNKFYAAIENSASALSFMGNYMGVASANLTKFIKDGTLGFKDASQAASSYMQVFQKMDWKSMQKVFAVTGGMEPSQRGEHPMIKIMEDVKKSMIGTETEGPLGEALKKRAQLEIKVKESKGGATEDLVKQIAQLDQEIRGYENRSKGFSAALENFKKTGDVAALSQFKELLAPGVAQTMALIESNQKLGPELKAAMIETVMKSMGVDEPFIRSMNATTDSIRFSVESLVSSLSGENTELIFNTKGSLKAMEDLVALSMQPDVDIQDLRSSFNSLGEKIFKDSKKASTFAQTMIQNLEMSPERIKEVKATLVTMRKQLELANSTKDPETKKNAMAAYEDAAASLNMSSMELAKYVDGDISNQQKLAKSAEANDESLWKEYIDKTTSLKDRAEILKESANYAIAKVVKTPADLLNKLVGGIAANVEILASDKKSKQDKKDEEFKKSFEGKTFQEYADSRAKVIEEIYKKGYQKEDKILSKEEAADKKKLFNRKDTLEYGMSEKVKGKNKEVQARLTDEANRVAKEKIVAANNEAVLAKDDARRKVEAARLLKEDGEKRLKAKELAEKQKKIDENIAKMGETPVAKEQKTPPPEVKDFRAERKGLTMLDKGDYAVNPSTGIGKPKGAFAQEIISKMFGLDEGSGVNLLKGGAAPSSISISLGGLHVNGDVSDPKVVQDAGKKITEMIEQAIRKHEREKQYA